LTLNM